MCSYDWCGVRVSFEWRVGEIVMSGECVVGEIVISV